MSFFIGKNTDCIVSSPLGRAFNTAKILCDVVGKKYDNILLDDRFKEIDLGDWTKKSKDILPYDETLYSYKTYKEKPKLFTPFKGENLYNLQSRVMLGFNDVIQKYNKFDSLIIVSHSIVIRTILLKLEDKDMSLLWSYNLPSASKTEIILNENKFLINKVGF